MRRNSTFHNVPIFVQISNESVLTSYYIEISGNSVCVLVMPRAGATTDGPSNQLELAPRVMRGDARNGNLVSHECAPS
jgi:hypothetical protein